MTTYSTVSRQFALSAPARDVLSQELKNWRYTSANRFSRQQVMETTSAQQEPFIHSKNES
jgi:hypothetical protein